MRVLACVFAMALYTHASTHTKRTTCVWGGKAAHGQLVSPEAEGDRVDHAPASSAKGRANAKGRH